MRYVVNLVYLGLLVALSPWLIWTSIKKGKYRQGWKEKFLGFAPIRSESNTCVWLHAVSVGEVNLIGKLIQRFENDLPTATICVSTTTKTGFELAQQKYSAHTVFFCPLDFSWAVSNALQRIRPDLLVLAELELWPNLIAAAHSRKIPIAIVNGRLSDKSFRGYRKLKPILASLLRKIDLIATQNDEYRDRFLQLGAVERRLINTGSLKFDGAETDRLNPHTVSLFELTRWSSDDVVFIAGSTQSPEEEYCLEAFQKLKQRYPKLRMIVVPRHPDRFDEVAQLLEQSGESWSRRSQLQVADEEGASQTESTNRPGVHAILVDTVGELGSWWGMADLAFVGGSMGSRGGQNMIEPAAFGAAVSFGPNTKNFRDIVAALLERDAAQVVNDKLELCEFIESGLADRDAAQDMGKRARRFVSQQRGATQQTFQALLQLIGPQRATQGRFDSPESGSTSAVEKG